MISQNRFEILNTLENEPSNRTRVGPEKTSKQLGDPELTSHSNQGNDNDEGHQTVLQADPELTMHSSQGNNVIEPEGISEI